jgi:hypothetical protein
MQQLLLLLLIGGPMDHIVEDDPFTRVVLEASAYSEGVDSGEKGVLFYDVGPDETTLGARGTDGTCSGVVWSDGQVTPLMDIACPRR